MKELKIKITDGTLQTSIEDDLGWSNNEEYHNTTLREYNIISQAVEKGRKDIINKQNAEAQENQVFDVRNIGLDIIIKLHGENQTRPCVVDFVIPRQSPDGHELMASEEVRHMNEFQFVNIPIERFVPCNIRDKINGEISTTTSQDIKTSKDRDNQNVVDILLKQYKIAKASLKSNTLQLKEGSLRDLTSKEFMDIEEKCDNLKEMILRIEDVLAETDIDLTKL